MLLIPAEALGPVTEAVAFCNRGAADLYRQERSRRAGRRPSTARFERGLMLVSWIDRQYQGKLTKKLVNEIKHYCKHWPEVRNAQKAGDHRPQERLRNALRNLAEDTRQALRNGRLPAGWATEPPTEPLSYPI
jgi:hypothetical protein